jgi:hypothetical protein
MHYVRYKGARISLSLSLSILCNNISTVTQNTSLVLETTKRHRHLDRSDRTDVTNMTRRIDGVIEFSDKKFRVGTKDGQPACRLPDSIVSCHVMSCHTHTHTHTNDMVGNLCVVLE